MKSMGYKNIAIIVGLSLLMFATRFQHFGNAFTLPDASLAIFFLGGLYLAGQKIARWIFLALLIQAAGIDYWATTQQGVSDWCVTPAYPFLALAYFAMWFAGSLIAPRCKGRTSDLLRVFTATTFASVLAFAISNASFFLFSGRYAEMSLLEYSARVIQFLPSYIAVALLYVAVARAIQIIFALRRNASRFV
jgi:hypothetical protein